MPFPSPLPQLAVPQCNLLSYFFADDRQRDQRPLWIDAADPSQSLSLSQTYALIKRFATGLDGLQIPTGAVVMTYTPNNIFMPMVYLAVAGSKRIFTGVNAMFTSGEVSYQMKLLNPTVVLVHPSLLGNCLTAAKENDISESHIFLLSEQHCEAQRGIKDWRSILGSEDVAQKWTYDPLDGAAAAETIACINFSSGTTGLPKGVCVSHANVVASVAQSISCKFGGSKLSEQNPGSETWLAFLPLYHAASQMMTIGMAARLRYKVYVLTGFVLEDYLRYVQEYKVNALQVSVPILVMFQKNTVVAEYDLSSVKHVFVGGAPLGPELQIDISSKFNVKMDRGYGMTETTCSVAETLQGEDDDASGSIGVIMPNTEFKLIGDDGHEVFDECTEGELLVRGPQISMGYWKNAAATQEMFDSEGFLRTGDMVLWRKDDKGRMKWFVVDRKKELIKTKGGSISPAELEAVLLQCPDVADAAVVGIKIGEPEEERPRAYVVLQESAKREGKVGEKEIKQYVEAKLAEFKWLEGGVKFVDVIPKLPSGKIVRKVIRELAKQDAEEMKRKEAEQS